MQREIDHRIHSRQSMLFQNRPIIGIWAQHYIAKNGLEIPRLQAHSITVNRPSHRAPSTAFPGPERPPRLRWLRLRFWYSRMEGKVCLTVLRLSGTNSGQEVCAVSERLR